MAAAFTIPSGTEWGIGYLWHRLDWLVHIDVAALGLLLVYTFSIVIHIFWCHQLGRYDGEINTATKKRFAADLNSQVATLKSIATTAPYLGLMGTCLGLLNALSVGIGMQRDAARALLATRIAAALVPAAAGVLVAIPATCSYEYVSMRFDVLLNGLLRRKYLLTNRFVLPPFAVIAAYGLAMLVETYTALPPVYTPQGFDIQIASQRCDPDLSNKLLVLHISKDGVIFFNLDEEHDWSSLQGRLSKAYSMRSSRILFLSADEGVSFQTVADAIDTVKGIREPNTSRPLNISLRLITPTINVACPKGYRE